MKRASIILLILNSLPLLIYPFVFMASIMGLAAGGGGVGAASPMLSFTVFLWGSLLYPLPWVIALTGSIVCMAQGRFKWALWQQLGVFAFLIIMLTLLMFTLAKGG